MKKESSIERRQFLKLSSTAVLAGFAGKIAGQPLQEEKSIIEKGTCFVCRPAHKGRYVRQMRHLCGTLPFESSDSR